MDGLQFMDIDLALAAKIDEQQMRRRAGIPDDACVVLTVGQFIDRKGRWILLEAAKKVVRVRGDIAFVWVMPDLPSGQDLERVRSYCLDGNFKMVRSRDLGGTRMDTLKFFRTADIFALPSFLEGLPIALLEAMAMGLPSVSTNVYAIPEALKDGETGLLIEAGDADALANAVLRLAEDRDLCQ